MLRIPLIGALALLLGSTVLSAQTPEAPGGNPVVEAPAEQEGVSQAQADEQEEQEEAEEAAAPAAAVQHHDYGPAGIMVRSNREDLAPLTLASGQPVAEAEYTLKSGGYYRIRIVADGSQELALSGSDFFRAVWVNEIVVEDIEIRPLGVHSLEFDAAGEAEMSFVAIMPGRYTLSIPGSSGETQRAVFNIQ